VYVCGVSEMKESILPISWEHTIAYLPNAQKVNGYMYEKLGFIRPVTK
jgi:hypothetical protein